MPNGDTIDSGRYSGNNAWLAVRLLHDQAAVTDGVWIEVKGFKRLSIDISGITTATLEVRGSNDPLKPLNTNHGRQLGANVTADAIVNVDVPVRWIKVRVSAHTSGTINANMQAVEN
jgi:hypothetical protein